MEKAGRSPTRFAVGRWQGLYHEKRGTFDTYEKAQRYADELNAILKREYGADAKTELDVVRPKTTGDGRVDR